MAAASRGARSAGAMCEGREARWRRRWANLSPLQLHGPAGIVSADPGTIRGRGRQGSGLFWQWDDRGRDLYTVFQYKLERALVQILAQQAL
jgi:hypothetical protein